MAAACIYHQQWVLLLYPSQSASHTGPTAWRRLALSRSHSQSWFSSNPVSYLHRFFFSPHFLLLQHLHHQLFAVQKSVYIKERTLHCFSRWPHVRAKCYLFPVQVGSAILLTQPIRSFQFKLAYSSIYHHHPSSADGGTQRTDTRLLRRSPKRATDVELYPTPSALWIFKGCD